MKYLLLTNHIWKRLVTDELTKPGLYQWRQVFNGDVRLFEETPIEEYENYDIIHVNLSARDIAIPIYVRKVLKHSSTKLVVNVDYAGEAWDKMFQDIKVFVAALKVADLVFAVEPYQRVKLELLLQRQIPVIPHPVDTKRLKKLKLSKRDRWDLAVAIYHRYDYQMTVPSFIATASGLTPVLLGQVESSSEEAKQLFPMVAGMLPYESYLEIVRHAKLGVEYYTIHSHGRFAAECACLDIPLIATNNNYLATVCFPNTTFSLLDVKTMMEKASELMENDGLYDSVVEYASRAIERFNWDNSRKRLLSCLGLK